jgi:hypothetical protein
MRRRAAISLVLGGGLVLVIAAQLGRPGLVPPLYDGVVVVEPYRWVVPPSGGAGDPGSLSQSEAIQGDSNEAFAATTTESPPQAQLLAPAGAFAVPAGAAAVQVDIVPMAPPSGASIVGNAYGFSVTGPDGSAVPIRPGSTVTIALRAPAGTSEARIVRLNGAGSPEALASAASGQTDTYLADVAALGTFAIVGSEGDTHTAQVLLTLGILLVVGVGGLVLVWVRNRRSAGGRGARSDGLRGRR